MAEDLETSTDPRELVPAAVLDATRQLLWVQTDADARSAAEDLVRALGGELVAPGANDLEAIPADLSFGAGEPTLPTAPRGSAARASLERYLTTFLIDARRALQLSGRTERLVEAAATDVLTGLPNRRMVGRALSRLSEDDTVIMLDLDHFKRVNDTLGHAAGDDVLRAFGAVLRATVRAGDIVGRFGGEEFVVVLGPPVGADSFLHRLRAEWLARRPYPITFSAGVALSVGDPNDTLALADAALYRAKDNGRDQWRWATRSRAEATDAEAIL